MRQVRATVLAFVVGVVLAGCAAADGSCPAPTGLPSLIVYGAMSDCKTYVPSQPSQPGAGVVQRGYSAGQPVYSADECIGPVINGVCHGQILPKSAYHKTCYGQMLNGVCTGPMF